MNWTGGSLQRTKKANAGQLPQQKAYWAKARADWQRTARTPVAPFCPSFLGDHDRRDPGGLTLFGSYSVRREGRSMTSGETWQREPVPRPENKWSAISGRGLCRHEVSSRRVTHHVADAETRRQAQQDLGRSKRKAPDADVEMQSLEANKKRLLAQQDWMGIKPSKPVSLQCLAYKQSEEMGRREMKNSKCSVAKRQKVGGEATREDADVQERSFAKPFQGRGKGGKGPDVGIGIGTDALTDTATDFARPKAYTEWEPRSDWMLFEHDNGLPRVFAPGREAHDYEDDGGRREWTLDKDAGDKLDQEQGQLSTRTRKEAESAEFRFRLADRARDDEYSVRLVCSGSWGSCMGIDTHKLSVMDRQETGETRQLGEAQSATACQAKGVYRETSGSEGRGGYAIDDQEPWTTYVAISDDCAKAYDARPHGRQVLQLGDTDTSNKSGLWNRWRPRASQGQGGGECLDTLHSDWGMLEGVRETQADGQRQCNCGHVPSLDEDERKWQAFVLG